MRDDFAVLILTHGRPENIVTLDTLKKYGYTGRVVIVIDDEDKTAPQYFEKYGDKVFQFNKKEVAKTFDQGDNFEDRRAIIYARNVSFDIAKELGLEYFIQLDDDYTDFQYRVTDSFMYETYEKVDSLDEIFEIMLEYYINTPRITSLAMAQGGDFIGGGGCAMMKNGIKLRRKAMNSFLCSPSRPFQFVGKINEDVNTYTCEASRGLLFSNFQNVSLKQKVTQSNEGGMTELYLDSGTYVKSFYSVMYHPSSVTIAEMGNKNKRIHHQVKWKNTTPMILDEKHKKKK